MRCALFCWLLILAACGRPSRPVSKLFTQDSGFVSKKDVLAFLASKHIGDTANKRWEILTDTDTFGKYYRLPNGNFIACLEDVGGERFENHLLLEVDSYDSILKKEHYIHWNYPCCWKNDYEGFMKSGDYFLFKFCQTGSDYCASSLYFFQQVTPQDSLDRIVQGYWNGMGDGEGNAWALNGKWHINGDSLAMQYQLYTFSWIDTLPGPEDSVLFNVLYLKDRRGWRVTDSTFLKKFKFY